MRKTVIQRFTEKVMVLPPNELDTGCWAWIGTLGGNGYGHISVGKKMVGTHRWIYEQVVGAIPEGLQLDHLCRHTWCCNWRHLELVTNRENSRRSRHHGPIVGTKRRKDSICIRGHLLTEDNRYYYYRNGKKYFSCRICNQMRYKEKNKFRTRLAIAERDMYVGAYLEHEISMRT